MKDISPRDEEFVARFERFKTRVRELRGLRVNQFIGLLDRNQLKRVELVEREIEDFVRKYGYSNKINPVMQESILTLYNSDIVMRRRIEQRLSSSGSRGPFIVPVVTHPSRTIENETDPESVDDNGNGEENGVYMINGNDDAKPDVVDNGPAAVDSGSRPAPENGRKSGAHQPRTGNTPPGKGSQAESGPGKATSYFVPTDREIALQASLLMGGRAISTSSLSTLRSAIRKKIDATANTGDSGVRSPEKVVKLMFTASGKVKIRVAAQERKNGTDGQDATE